MVAIVPLKSVVARPPYASAGPGLGLALARFAAGWQRGRASAPPAG